MPLKAINLLFGLALLAPAVSGADMRTIDVHVPANFHITEAIGLLMTSGRTTQKVASKTDQVNEDTLVVSFNYDSSELEGESFASALVLGNEGEVRYGEVKLIAGTITAKSYYSLPECPPKEISKAVGQDQAGLLESLAEIRAARREAHQWRVTTLMQGSFLEKLQRLEKGFGFQYPKPLSAELNAYELADRLSRLSNAIQNYHDASKPAG